MCGDLEEEDRLETALYARFRSHANTLLRRRPKGAPADAHSRLHGRALRRCAAARCARDGDAAEESRRYELLAAQPVVFARLAGFLAAHAAPGEDPLRKVIEALMHGYAEAERIPPDHGHDHDDDDHDAWPSPRPLPRSPPLDSECPPRARVAATRRPREHCASIPGFSGRRCAPPENDKATERLKP